VLEDAGIRDADCFAAVTSGDNSNIVAARTAKEHYRVPQVIARIYDPRRAEIYRGLGISTIASVTWTSTRLLDMVTHADLHSEYQYGDADVEMMEVPLLAGLIGHRIADLAVPGEIAVGTILRHGKGILPEPGTTFEKDDTLYINVLRESAEKLERLLGFKE
jgi:trk system potassium uptake protein TrkA